MSAHFRYTVYMDDASKLCGYSPQVFYGTGTKKDGDELIIGAENGVYYNINYSRVRWYTCEPVTDEVAEQGVR